MSVVRSIQSRRFPIGVLVSLGLLAAACATFPRPNEVQVPQARMDNEGKYFCPFTQDEVLAEWCDMSIKAKASAKLGSAIGAYAGERLARKIPIIGGFLGAKVGEAAGRAIAIKQAGGWEHIRETSDISFDSLDDMGVYMYARFSGYEHYKEALDAATAIYPKLRKRYAKAIYKARIKR